MDIREAFEGWARSTGFLSLRLAENALKDIGATYSDVRTESAWRAWQAALQSQPQWVRCEDRLPTEGGAYAVFANDIVSSWVTAAVFTDGQWWFGGEPYPPIVTHWMHLPQPPEDPCNS